jgi:hypothetical protein
LANRIWPEREMRRAASFLEIICEYGPAETITMLHLRSMQTTPGWIAIGGVPATPRSSNGRGRRTSECPVLPDPAPVFVRLGDPGNRRSCSIYGRSHARHVLTAQRLAGKHFPSNVPNLLTGCGLGGRRRAGGRISCMMGSCRFVR